MFFVIFYGAGALVGVALKFPSIQLYFDMAAADPITLNVHSGVGVLRANRGKLTQQAPPQQVQRHIINKIDPIDYGWTPGA